MRINLASVLVDDQEKALRFYTDVLGFVKKTEVPLGEHSWLTVVSPEEPDGVELVLEPDEHPAVRPFKEALVADGIPFTSFAVDDVQKEYERLTALGVTFTQEPTAMGAGHHRGLRRHLRQPDPDRRDVRLGPRRPPGGAAFPLLRPAGEEVGELLAQEREELLGLGQPAASGPVDADRLDAGRHCRPRSGRAPPSPRTRPGTTGPGRRARTGRCGCPARVRGSAGRTAPAGAPRR